MGEKLIKLNASGQLEELEIAATNIDNDSNVPDSTTVTDALNTLYVAAGSKTLPSAIGLSALKAVYIKPADGKVNYASNDDAATTGLCVGITKEAEGSGSIIVMTEGIFNDTHWAWAAGSPIFVGTGGNLTQTVPTKLAGAAYLQEVGLALTATSMKIEIQPAITLV